MTDGDQADLAGADGGVQLSVIIACYNAQATLADQLAALAGQHAPVRWEVLVCDNGSTDHSVEVASGFADRLPLRVIDARTPRGPGAARNAGASAARGSWLAFCDADDIVGDGWLAAMAAALAEHAFVAGTFEACRLNGAKALRSRDLDQAQGLQHSPTGAELPHAGAGNMGIHRDLFDKLGGFDTGVAVLEDTDLSWRVQQVGVALTYVPGAVVHVRLRSTWPQMYRQGYAYGQAHALLEARYPGGPGRTADVAEPVGAPGPEPHRGSAGPGARVRATARAWLGRRPSVGRVVWQLGWHRGYWAGPPTAVNHPERPRAAR